jgi:hypothetical protein
MFRPVSKINNVMQRMRITKEVFRKMTLKDILQSMIEKKSNWLESECRSQLFGYIKRLSEADLTFLREQLERDRDIMERANEFKLDVFDEVRNLDSDHPVLRKAIMIDKWQDFLSTLSGEGDSNLVRRLGYIKIPHVLNVS